ncbi:glycine-rich cell wall structural protein-like [Cryptomeria japonica]|uniref:glycine-rich cell wall structural protein-like n=1 Tax=Cryptomeria japonica TaxID=3369 RepID=UPI0027DA9CF5|nr:glycine-rich cell wall structural protein-like [Cryptomeria japonica]
MGATTAARSGQAAGAAGRLATVGLGQGVAAEVGRELSVAVGLGGVAASGGPGAERDEVARERRSGGGWVALRWLGGAPVARWQFLVTARPMGAAGGGSRSGISGGYSSGEAGASGGCRREASGGGAGPGSSGRSEP